MIGSAPFGYPPYDYRPTYATMRAKVWHEPRIHIPATRPWQAGCYRRMPRWNHSSSDWSEPPYGVRLTSAFPKLLIGKAIDLHR
ncbi:hypothetical protein PSCICJ_04710 [Pseudomonas cichorii]|nr:hypothetical protein PSCICJ_04710 [Pseudomonas cichorii]